MFGDGKNHTLPYSIYNGAPKSGSGCLSSPNLHAKDEASAAGSAFAISYNSNLADVRMDNLVVFTVLKKHTLLQECQLRRTEGSAAMPVRRLPLQLALGARRLRDR